MGLRLLSIIGLLALVLSQSILASEVPLQVHCKGPKELKIYPKYSYYRVEGGALEFLRPNGSSTSYARPFVCVGDFSQIAINLPILRCIQPYGRGVTHTLETKISSLDEHGNDRYHYYFIAEVSAVVETNDPKEPLKSVLVSRAEYDIYDCSRVVQQ